MIAKLNLFIHCILLVIVSVSCKSDQEPNDIVKNEKEIQVEVKDTLFGNLSIKEQYFQHIALEVPQNYQFAIDSLANWVVENQPGVMRFINWEQDSIIKIKSMLDTLPIIEPLYLENYFDFLAIQPYPYWKANGSSNKALKWMEIFQSNHSQLVDFQYSFNWDKETYNWLKLCSDSLGLKFITQKFQDRYTVRDFDLFCTTLKESDQIIELELNHFDTVDFDQLRTKNNFEGLFMTKAKINTYNQLITNGMDYLIVSLENTDLKTIPFSNWNYTKEDLTAFQKSTARILALKRNKKNKTIRNDLAERKAFVASNLLKNSTVLLNPSSSLFPLKKGIKIYGQQKVEIDKWVRKSNNIQTIQVNLDSTQIQKIRAEKGVKLILLPDTLALKTLKQVSETVVEDQLIICFSDTTQYSVLKNTPNLVFYLKNETQKNNFSIRVQQLTGQLAVNGNLVLNDTIITGEQQQKIKLARTEPAFCGINKDSLFKINQIVNAAINGRAFPGCQVMVVKNGCIVYDKSFGYHTYKRQKKVNRNSMYDLASLTKVVSTTLVGMKLYELEAYKLNDSLSTYLPDSLKDYLQRPSTIQNITFQELFIHKSGLPVGFPILKYMQYTTEEIGPFDKYFCDIKDVDYSVEVAENFFLEKEYQDSMWITLNKIWLDKSKPYRYSDVNMNTLYFIFKRIIHSNPKDYTYNFSKKELKKRNLFVQFLYDNFYKPLEMNHTRYKPLKYFNKAQIVATENETYWRRQLLQGYVHDPNAALHGGIAGNAGVFSTANDLAILGQMLLNKGVYNNKRYLSSETIDKFVSTQPNSHRGLGWNKPSVNTSTYACAPSASPLTYGHTGFTGTCIWMDPTENLTFIFLSNRVHPKVNNRIYQYNVRAKSHQAVYDGKLD